MEDIAFSDWPGQPVDLSGSNPWLPAYGFQQPILEKEDFLGSPDAALFLNDSASHQYVFLETIMEETSDDLRSDSERSTSRASQDESGVLGWLATDSDSGSVIRVEIAGIDDHEDDPDEDNTSECDLVCPAKRRRHDGNLLAPPCNLANGFSDEDTNSLPSLSRSSSLLQFETLEKRCQEDVYNSSPSILSSFSYDSLENPASTTSRQRSDLSPDSLNNHHSDSDSDSYKSECEYYKNLKIDGKTKKQRVLLFYKTKLNESKNSDADSENSSDSDVAESCDEILPTHSRSISLRSVRNLKSFRSFEGLNMGSQIQKKGSGYSKDKMSAENLSEDSGYCDHLFLKQKSSSIPNFNVQGICIPENSTYKTIGELRTSNKRKSQDQLDMASLGQKSAHKRFAGFDAYDGEPCFPTSSASHFGASYQDLSIFDPNKINVQFKNNLQKLGLRKLHQTKHKSPAGCDVIENQRQLERETQSLKLEIASEFVWTPKISGTSASEPNLWRAGDSVTPTTDDVHNFTDCFTTDVRSTTEQFARTLDQFTFNHNKHNYFETSVLCAVSSVPKNLNLAGHADGEDSPFSITSFGSDRTSPPSVAFKNWDLCDLTRTCEENQRYGPPVTIEKDTMAETSANNTVVIRVKDNNAIFGSDQFSSVEVNQKCIINDVAAKLEMGTNTKETSSYSINEGVTKLLDVTADDQCYNLDIHSEILEFEESLQKAISNSSIPSFTDKDDFFFHSTPMNKRNVLSTPNLTTFSSEIDFIENITQNVALRGSMQHVPLKKSDTESNGQFKGLSGSEGKIVGGILNMSTNRSSFAGSGSTTKGVHFCEIVSEVSWREASYSEDDLQSECSTDSSGSGTSSHEDDIPTPDEEKPEMHTSDLDEIMIKVADQIDQDGSYVKSYADGDGVIYKHTHLGNVYKRRPSADGTPPTSHVSGGTGESTACHNSEAPQVVTVPSVSVMEPASAQQRAPLRGGQPTLSTIPSSSVNVNNTTTASGPTNNGDKPTLKRPKSSSANKLGGFLSRFTNFRFSTRSKNNDKKKSANANDMQTKSAPIPPAVTTDAASNQDYIYIPLKGPLTNSHRDGDESIQVPSVVRLSDPEMPTGNKNISKILLDGKPVEGGAPPGRLNHNQSLSAKPPLPKLPPRVIGASVKRGYSTPTPAHRIDSTGAVRGATGAVNSGHRRHNAGGATSVSNGTGAVDRHAFSAQMEQPLGLIETDLDTHITVVNSVVANGKTRSLMNLGGDSAGVHRCTGGPTLRGVLPPKPVTVRPHKSMEFLLDKQNLKVVEPPENELQKGTGERVMSEHQLRVQRSLQKLTVPDWFKQSQVPREGFLLKKRDNTKWSGLAGKTTSLSSLGSRQSPILLSPSSQSGGQVGFTRWSTSKLNSTASSPCNSTRSSFNYRQPIAGVTSNGTTSPCSSTRSSFNYRQPYLGWRSQERLARPRTPAERLATSLLPPVSTAANSEIQSSIKEVTSAIVHYVSGLRPDTNTTDSLTVIPRLDSNGSSPRYDRESASTSPRLRDYETQDTASQRSISPASRGSQKLCWLESSFVGTRPLDSPQTPLGIPTDASDVSTETVRAANYPGLRLDLKTKTNMNAESCSRYPSSGNLGPAISRPSPGSTTLEDVLDSLLGLPPSTRAPSPSLQETVSANSSPGHSGIVGSDHERLLSTTSNNFHYAVDTARRRSEGSERERKNSDHRRVSFHTTPNAPTTEEPSVRCRFSKCSREATAEEARKTFKNCHNCTYTYCSRECRRAHWEKHRKTCLHSRASSLCRQILAKAKDDCDTLQHISILARQGFLSHGAGVVKCFFPSPEAAERFIGHGLPHLSEPTYVRWPDLLPSEMGPELFSELVKICKSYNPDTRLVLYVAVCVVSEVPTSGTIKWERQLVSRCAKLRLSKSVQSDSSTQILIQTRPKSPCNITREMDNPETLILTSLPGCRNQMSVQRSREISFTNIQRQLRQRGVSLRRHFPEVYQKLCAYVEGASDRFAPVTVYPKDSSSGKNFMCIIMPDVEPEKLDIVPHDSTRVQTIDVGQRPE